MKTIKKMICLLLAAVLLAGCGKSGKAEPIQLDPAVGDHIAVITFADYGSISVRLFGNTAPEAVEQFIRLAQEGMYTGSTLKSVIDDYCLMVTGSAADNHATDKAFKDEINNDYYPLRGALCITGSGDKISAQQFMIVTSDTEFLKELETLLAYRKITPAEYYKTAYGTDLDEDTLALFEKYGGAPWLYGHCIVFGQVSEGFEVLEAISDVEVEDGNTYSPLEDIIIESVSIEAVNK